MTMHTSRRLFAWAGVAVLGLACIGALLMLLTDNALGLLDEPGDDAGTYFAVFALVFGDAVFAIFPGETTLNTASVLASNGELDLGIVIVAGFLGAWIGDNVLYWIARSVPILHTQIEQAQADERFKKIVALVNRSSFILVVVCRFLPFVRWAVVAGMGALPMPYGRFFIASTIGALAWSTYTCLMAYFIGTALADFPIASVAMACASSAILLGIGWAIWRRVRHASTEGAELAPG
jgi:membrane protein DedA with SNARE-associated domain